MFKIIMQLSVLKFVLFFYKIDFHILLTVIYHDGTCTLFVVEIVLRMISWKIIILWQEYLKTRCLKILCKFSFVAKILDVTNTLQISSRQMSVLF